MFVIAVTGGIACGKSSVSALLSEFVGDGSCEVFDCDRSVGDLLDESNVVEELIRLGVDHELNISAARGLDRPAMRNALFENESFRNDVEAYVHPMVLEAASTFLSQRRDREKLLLLEVPLLFEVEFPVKRDMVLVVAASPATQMRRLTEVRGFDSYLAEKMLTSQMPIHEKMTQGDVVIWNDGGMSSLHEQLEHLAARFNLLDN